MAADRAGCLAEVVAGLADVADFFAVVAGLADVAALFADVVDLADVAEARLAEVADFVAGFFDLVADVAAARFADFATEPVRADLFAAARFAEDFVADAFAEPFAADAFAEPLVTEALFAAGFLGVVFADADFLPGAFVGGFAGALVFAFTVPPRFELALVTLCAYRGMTNKKSRGGTNR